MTEREAERIRETLEAIVEAMFGSSDLSEGTRGRLLDMIALDVIPDEEENK